LKFVLKYADVMSFLAMPLIRITILPTEFFSILCGDIGMPTKAKAVSLDDYN
jgi:hypothetical protein